MMELKISKETLKRILSYFISFLKDLRTLPNFWLYISLSIALFILFFITTFPYEVLIRNKLNDIGGSFGKSFYVGNIDVNLFGSSTIKNLTLALDNGSEFDFENIDMNISIFSALLSETIEGSLEIPNFEYNKEKTSLNSMLSSEFKLGFNSYSEFPSNGFILLKLQNAQLKGMTIKDFNIPPIRFTLVDADIKIIKKSLSINSFKLSGPDLNGNIKGDITFTKVASGSRINLTLEIDSNSALLANYKILLGNSINSENKLIVNLRGTISNPQINLTPGAAAGSSADDRGNAREGKRAPSQLKDEEMQE